MMNNYAPLQGTASDLAQYGRYGDSMLVHMNPAEVDGIASLSPTGRLTVNPVTGQPEAFLSVIAPFLGSILGAAGLTGIAGMSTAMAGAIGAGMGSWLESGDIKEGLMSGITGYGVGKALGTVGMGAQDPALITGQGASVSPESLAQIRAHPELFQPDILEAARPAFEGASFGERMAMYGGSGTDLIPHLIQQSPTIFAGEMGRAQLEADKAAEEAAAGRGRDEEEDLQRQYDILSGAWRQIGKDYPSRDGVGLYRNGGMIQNFQGGGQIDDPRISPFPAEMNPQNIASIQQQLAARSPSPPPNGGGLRLPDVTPSQVNRLIKHELTLNPAMSPGPMEEPYVTEKPIPDMGTVYDWPDWERPMPMPERRRPPMPTPEPQIPQPWPTPEPQIPQPWPMPPMPMPMPQPMPETPTWPDRPPSPWPDRPPQRPMPMPDPRLPPMPEPTPTPTPVPPPMPIPQPPRPVPPSPVPQPTPVPPMPPKPTPVPPPPPMPMPQPPPPPMPQPPRPQPPRPQPPRPVPPPIPQPPRPQPPRPQPRPDWPHDPMPDPRKPTPVPPPPTPPLSREERREAGWEKRQRGNRLEQMSDRFKNLLGNLDSRQTPTGNEWTWLEDQGLYGMQNPGDPGFYSQLQQPGKGGAPAAPWDNFPTGGYASGYAGGGLVQNFQEGGTVNGISLDPLAAAARQASIRGAGWVAPPELNVEGQPWRAGFDPEHLYFGRGKDIGFSPFGGGTSGGSTGAGILAPEDVAELPTQQTVVGGSAMVPSAVPDTSVGSAFNPSPNVYDLPGFTYTEGTGKDFPGYISGTEGYTGGTFQSYDESGNVIDVPVPTRDYSTMSPEQKLIAMDAEMKHEAAKAAHEEDIATGKKWKFPILTAAGKLLGLGEKGEEGEGDGEEGGYFSGIGSLLSAIKGKGGRSGGMKDSAFFRGTAGHGSLGYVPGQVGDTGVVGAGMGATGVSTATAGRAAATAGPLAGSLSLKDDSGFQYEQRKEAAMERREAHGQFLKELFGEEERNIDPNVDFSAALAKAAGVTVGGKPRHRYDRPGRVLKKGSIPMSDMVLADPSKARLLRKLLRGDAKTMQGGGITDLPVEGQQEAMMSDLDPAMQQEAQMADELVQQTILAILGRVDDPDIIIDRFIDEFGQEAYLALREEVLNSVVPGAQTEGLIRGQGDGMSDEVTGMIGDQQQVATSPGEYIVPADVVSGIGNGSSNSGASQLDGMIDGIRQARTGTEVQPEAIIPEEFMPV